MQDLHALLFPPAVGGLFVTVVAVLLWFDWRKASPGTPRERLIYLAVAAVLVAAAVTFAGIGVRDWLAAG